MSPFTRVSWVPLAAFFVLSLLLEVRAGDDGCPMGGGGGAGAGASARIETQINTQTQSQTNTGLFSSLVTSATPVVTENTISSGNNAAVQADPMIEGLESITGAKREKLPDKTTTFDPDEWKGCDIAGATQVDIDTDGNGDYDRTETTWPDGTKMVRDTKMEPTEADPEAVRADTQVTYPDGSTQRSTEITSSSGITSESEKTWPDGKTEKSTAAKKPGDRVDQGESVTETKWPDGKTQTSKVDRSGDTETVTTYPDGKTVTDTSSKYGGWKTETKHPDGTTESQSSSTSPSGMDTTTTKDRDGKTTTKTSGRYGSSEETTYPDGTKETSKEALTQSDTVKTFPDGTVIRSGPGWKTKTYPDGRSESFSNASDGGTTLTRTDADGKSTTSYLPPREGGNPSGGWQDK